MNADELKKMQEIRNECTRKLDFLRQQQADIVRDFLAKKEKKQQEEILSKLNN